MVVGTGGSTGDSDSNSGVSLVGGEIVAGGAGNLSVQANGGLDMNNATVSAYGGNVNLRTPQGTVTMDNLGRIATGAANGMITIAADGIVALSPTGGKTIDAGAGTVNLIPITAGMPIYMGAEIFGTLSFNGFDLYSITAKTVNIGTSASGAITVDGYVIFPSPTNVNLTSGSDIIFDSVAINTDGGTLTLHNGSSGAVTALSPGATVDTVPAAVQFAPGSNLAINLAGSGQSTQYGQLNVTGDVNLTGVNLALSGTLVPADGQTFTIVRNNGSHPIIGTFNGLPEGSVIANFFGISAQRRHLLCGGRWQRRGDQGRHGNFHDHRHDRLCEQFEIRPGRHVYVDGDS